MKNMAIALIMGSILTVLPGCIRQPIRISSTSYADTTKISNGFSKDKSFAVASIPSADGAGQQNELQSKELEQKIAIAMNHNGYHIENSASANYYLLFDYGIKAETKTLNVAKYIPGQTVTSTGSLSGTYGYYGQYNQLSTSSGTYVYMPEDHTFFTKFLNFYVYDANECKTSSKNKTPPQIWQGTAWNIDEYGDLRAYLDFLIVHLVRIFGKNSVGTITNDMYGDDQSVALLRHTYLNPSTLA